MALVRGSTLIYADTYEQALAQLQAEQGGKPVQILTPATPAGVSPTISTTTPSLSDPRIETIRMHLDRYRQLSAQGKWAEAGKELEAVQSAVK